MIETPEQFFLRNGGAEMLQLSGDTRQASLEGFLKTRWPTWPKENAPPPDPEKSPAAGTTTPAGQSTAAIIVWEGGMILHTSANMQVPKHVQAKRASTMNTYYRLANETVMNLPRPLLMVTIGKSTDVALKNLRLCIDSEVIESCGAYPFTINRNDLDTIAQFCALFEIKPIDASRLRSVVETSLAWPSPRYSTQVEIKRGGQSIKSKSFHANHPKIIKQARMLAELPPKPSEDPDEFRAELASLGSFWSAVASLPPRSSPAWTLAMFPENGKTEEAAS